MGLVSRCYRMNTRKTLARPTSNTPAKRTDHQLTRPTDARRGQGTNAKDLRRRSPTDIPGAESVPGKWRWHHRVLLALRSRLLGDRGALMLSVAEPLERHSLDEADSASDEIDHNLALGELSSGQEALYEVEEALRRIRNGAYGVCLETGQPIPAARLRAVPWARFSREVEARLERSGLIKRPGLGTLGSVRGEGKGIQEAEDQNEEEPSAQAGAEALHLIRLPTPSPRRLRKTPARRRARRH